MKITVCLKQAPDFDMVMADDWAVNDEGGLDIDYANRIINCFDEVALEYALRLKEAHGGSVQALTVGGPECDAMLRAALALEVDAAARIEVEEGADLRFAPATVAGLLSAAIAAAPLPDLVLMGRQAGVGDAAVVPQLCAEWLGFHCISNLLELTPAPDGRLAMAHQAPEGVRRLLVRPPAVATIGNMGDIALRSATLKARIAAKRRSIDQIRISAAHTLPQPAFMGLKNRVIGRECDMMETEDPREIAVGLLHLLNGEEANA